MRAGDWTIAFLSVCMACSCSSCHVKGAPLRVRWNGFIPTIFCFVTGRWSFDACVVRKGQRSVRDLGLEDKNNIAVKDRHGAGPSLWQACQSDSTYRGLHGSEIARGRVECAVVVTDEEVEDGVAGAPCHSFDDLVGDRGNA